MKNYREFRKKVKVGDLLIYHEKTDPYYTPEIGLIINVSKCIKIKWQNYTGIEVYPKKTLDRDIQDGHITLIGAKNEI